MGKNEKERKANSLKPTRLLTERRQKKKVINGKKATEKETQRERESERKKKNNRKM